MAKPKVLVTGANGLIGGLAIRGLADRYEFSGFSRHPVEGIPYTVGDIRDLDLVRSANSMKAFRGAIPLLQKCRMSWASIRPGLGSRSRWTSSSVWG